MGSLIGHVAPGLVFLITGLWHLISHIKLHSRNPKTYTSLPWFPTPRFKHLELYFIIASCSASISMELFVGPSHHQPLDPDDFTIPSNHLHNFEHSNISLSFLVYAFLSIIIDKLAPPAWYELTNLLASVAFGLELLLFHLHSTDHMGLEGQYHCLLQIAIFVSLVASLLAIGHPKSFSVSFVRSISVVFQGVWLNVIGIMLYTPSLIPKGCFLIVEDGRNAVRCDGDEALGRAKSLVNIMFSWYVLGVMVLGVVCYLVVNERYASSGKAEYRLLSIEAQKKSTTKSGIEESKYFLLPHEKPLIGAMDIER